MKQSQMLLETVGDAWLERNRDALGKLDDPVQNLIALAEIKPTRVLELGCSNGWRLAALRAKYGCQVMGIEPSAKAVSEATANKVPCCRGTADSVPIQSASFDLVISGFIFFYLDPEDHFRVVAEADRLLVDGGNLITYEHAHGRSFKRKYKYDDRVYNYAFDPTKLWLGHPGYHQIGHIYSGLTAISATLLRKDFASAFPLEPYGDDA